MLRGGGGGRGLLRRVGVAGLLPRRRLGRGGLGGGAGRERGRVGQRGRRRIVPLCDGEPASSAAVLALCGGGGVEAVIEAAVVVGGVTSAVVVGAVMMVVVRLAVVDVGIRVDRGRVRLHRNRLD